MSFLKIMPMDKIGVFIAQSSFLACRASPGAHVPLPARDTPSTLLAAELEPCPGPAKKKGRAQTGRAPLLPMEKNRFPPPRKELTASAAARPEAPGWPEPAWPARTG